MEQKIINRDLKIDVIRSIAILLMFFAHALPHLYLEQYNIIERIISSLAAPIFLFLLGYNLNLSSKTNSKKGLFILILAAFIDVFIWHIIPFYSFDVLYLIGFTLLFSNFSNYIKPKTLIIFILIIILTSFVYNYNYLYSVEIPEPELQDYNKISIRELLKNLFFDGWFPIFPWIIYPILGQIIKNKKQKFNDIKLFLISFIAFVIFTIYFCSNNTYLREFAVEIFYPLNYIYLIGSLGFIYLVFYLINHLNLNKLNFIALIGKSSLFFYFFHLLIYHL